MKKAGIALAACLFIAMPAIFFSASAQALTNSDCLGCHDIGVLKFEASVHGAIPCTGCHSDVEAIPHKRPKSVSCAGCHRGEQQIYLASDHGRGVAEGEEGARPCEECHGEAHSILDGRAPESPTSRGRINGTCSRCHDDRQAMEGHRLTQREPLKSYMASVHGKAFERGEAGAAVCTDCHGSHDLNSPINPESKIYKFNVPATCGRCHENIFNTYRTSVHAKALYAGVKDAPVCTDCHGEHGIQRHTEEASSVYPASIVKTCAHCHDSEKITEKYGLPKDVVPTYLESYHGVAYRYGSLVAANCASCHGFHDILESSDPRSSINKANIGRTCGKCHPGAGEQLSQGSVHIRPAMDRDAVIFYVSLAYIILITLTIGGMLAHNILDYAKKLKGHYRRAVSEAAVPRLTRGERIAHIILLVSFFILAYTGFAHRYPNAFFSYPFSAAEWGPMARKAIHRAAGLIFIALMCYQAIWLFSKDYGRQKLKALFPRVQDIRDAIALVRFNAGLGGARPRFERFSYIEKAEWWALVWGSIVMILTGLVLMFENVSLHYLPKWLIDVLLLIHFFEAILATLAILVWHLYWVMFDPDIYPMNWAWITGKLTARQLEERKEGPPEAGGRNGDETNEGGERSES